jgi:vacuolar-type H+-ATPase catalytic subunit A/Vma1
MAEAKTSKVNYTEAMVETMLNMYAELGNEGLDEIADKLQRPVRSIRSKLVREGVYVAAEKPKAAKREEGPTKKELLNQLESLVAFDVSGLMGATKEAIAHVIAMAESQTDAPAEDADESVDAAA